MAGETKLDNLVFEEDPLRYCKAAYDKALEHIETLEPGVVEDKDFYYGVDPELEARRNDTTVIRAAHYVPECSTAIDTRASAVLDRGQEDSPLVRLNPTSEFEEDEDVLTELSDKEDKLADQLIKSGFLFDVYMEWFYGAELQPLSVIKIGKEEKYGWVAKRKPIIKQVGVLLMSLLKGRMPTMEERTQYIWELLEVLPTVRWLNWDEFLYIPSGKSLDELDFVIHRQYWNWNQILDEAKADGWDMNEVNKLKEEGGGPKVEDSHAEKVDNDLGSSARKYMREGKYLIAEFWVVGKDDDGRNITNRVILGNNVLMFKKEVNPIPTIRLPFIIRKAWPKLGHFEGRSSISLVKDTQRIHNDAHNTFLDGCTFGIFPPLLKKHETAIYGNPKYGPARFLEVDDIEGIKALEPNIGKLELLPALANDSAAKIRQILNAPDTNQGISDDVGDMEKATKTRLRVMGAMRRMRPLFESVKEDIQAVADMFIKVNQADDPSWILPYELDVPAFSGVSTPDEERMNSVMLFELAMKNPLYASPMGQVKLLQLWVDVLTKSRIEDINSRCLSKEELMMEMMKQQMAAQQAQAEAAQTGGQSDANLPQVPRRPASEISG